MAAPTRVRREHLNCRFYFIPKGESVDSPAVTVDRSTWPDANPVANWTNYQFRDIEKCTPDHKVETEEWKVPADSGGYDNDSEEQVQKRSWKMITSWSNSYIKRLEQALPSTPVVDTAQTPGQKNDNFILGVGLFEFQNKNGDIVERFQLWGKLRLVNQPGAEPKSKSFEISFEQQSSGNNTYVLK